ncbi:manganese efflux pump MntP [Kangiella koreensis]|uniref:Putative manganese efflux pump MntP n=1 Tax=Kangiella koreensis (strain DSM 16069 / JCM 12317 / KCTC 12182 / SW-125) TaxID=523791 RepID=C7R6M4_KANKD|nr:manganese efflux pump MntP family protein [Kangiella koreensis]ACV25540.1 protein of unknown function DUF204 [Kangiella koreensis DSM 16069]
MIEVIILALALSMDAFAVSVGLGSKPVESHKKLAIWAAVYFGLFQGLMPLVGYLGGKGLLGWIEAYAPWIAFLLLLFIGGKMIFEAFSEGIEEDISQITQRVMLTLAIATSIDAMAAGFALNLLQVNALVACLIIGLVTFVMSAIGVYIGKRSGTWLESKAELLGGVVLILIGIKIVLG